jgi:hypothetical protein
MAFDPEPHKINLILIKCGKKLFSDVKDITKLAKLTADAIGVNFAPISSKEADHLPGPEESGPKFNCIWCGVKQFVVFGLCDNCKDSEGGKFKSKVHCYACGKSLLSPDHLITWYKDLGYDFTPGMKKGKGIKTLTDEGPK